MTICSFAVTIHDNKVLLVQLGKRYTYASYWSFPGGQVEPGESLQEAAKREVFEETGANVTIGNHITTFISNDNQINMFFADYFSGDIVHQQSEIMDAQWFGKEEVFALPLAYNVGDILCKVFTK